MDDNTQSKIEHLKMIQGVVTRMAGNSAQMKAWTVSLVTAILVFSGVSDNPHWLVGLGGCFPVVALWIMDARYLHLERCYIALYSEAMSGNEIDDFDLDYRPYVGKVDSVIHIARSWSVGGFYGPILVAMMVLLTILFCRG